MVCERRVNPAGRGHVGFWNVICVANRTGRLYASGYIVSQQDYVLDIPFERLPVGPNSTRPEQHFQVAIHRIEQETGLIFDDAVRAADVYTGPQSGRRIRSAADIEHPRR